VIAWERLRLNVVKERVDKIVRFNPKTEKWVKLPFPRAESDARRIEIDQENPNRI
jgi:streptogramin lyase